MSENGNAPDVTRPLAMESGALPASARRHRQLQEVAVPRYSARIFDGNNPTLQRSRYVWAPDVAAAVEQVKQWLVVVRQTQSRMRTLDRWTVSARLSPHRAPEVIAAGEIRTRV